MSKAREKKPEKAAKAIALEIKAALLDEHRDDVIMVFIPSHDRHNKELKNQDFWADAGLRLFGELYTGATVFTGLRGIWRCDDGIEVIDRPYLIQSLAKRDVAADGIRLE